VCLTLLPSLLLGRASVAAAAGCEVVYSIPNQWGDGFLGDVTIKNNGAALTSWTLGWTFSGNQRITNLWNGLVSQSGQAVTVNNAAWNGAVASGGTVNFGFQGTYAGANAKPTSFVLNGMVCGGTPPPTATTVPPTATPINPTATVVPPTATATPRPATATPINPTATVVPPTATATPINPTATTVLPTATPINPTATVAPTPLPGVHVANPFAGAQGYINPDYAARVRNEALLTGGSLGAQMNKVASYPTAVWLDRIGAIAGGPSALSLRGHLDAALLQQQSSGAQVVFEVVIYDLPNRDCAALASNGELQIAQNGLARYKAEYIDPIASILGDAKYRSLRIAAIVEPDSLPNLLTNLGNPKCAEANSSGAYVQGVQYAINKLHPLSNVYLYLDIAHSGWLGWDNNFSAAIQQYTQVVNGTTDKLNSIDGFISNTANYTPLFEQYLPDPALSVGGQPVRSATFYQWNPHFDEVDFVTALRTAFINAGFPSGIGMLIDTSRNGWGGAARPSAVSSSTNLNTYVSESRLDRRLHRGNWCNQDGAALGERPTAAPQAGIDAYVWVKPPGESDGISEQVSGPNEEGKSHDPMCDPDFIGSTQSNGNNRTGALDNAPHAGQWFPAQFAMLVRNAYPAVTP
jgi:cellulose 1,4-beta-cellobiosidase